MRALYREDNSCLCLHESNPRVPAVTHGRQCIENHYIVSKWPTSWVCLHVVSSSELVNMGETDLKSHLIVTTEAKLSYDMEVKVEKQQRLYQLFLDWALAAKVDGIVVGATFPKIIQYCSQKAKKNLSIFSPGVGTQGGNATEVISSGTDYLIVGRTILNSKNPVAVAQALQLESFGK